MATFRGTTGDDTISGSGNNDNFLLWQGGSDTVDGGGGDDTFRMAAALDAGDKLDGGTGKDAIVLNGDYSAGLVLNADTITNIEVMQFVAGHSYNLTTNDGNVAAGERLLVKAEALGAGNTLTFDGSAELDGKFTIIGGAGNDTLTGGARHDVFDLTHGGNDTAHGGGGNDTFLLGSMLTAADQIDGGTGDDTLELNGTYNLTLGATTFTGIDTLKVDNGHRYQITANDGNVAAGQTLTVDFSAMTSSQFVFNGSSEIDGNFRFIFGSANVLLNGGNGNDIFDATHAGNASVELYGNGGDDTFLVGADYNHILVFSLDGGSGNDTIEFNGDYPSLVEVGIETTSVETIRFDGGHTYSNVVIGEPIGAATIDASQVSTLFHLAFTNGNYTIEVGSGGMSASPYDSSSHNDTFVVTSEASLAASTLDAGNGSDTLELNGDFSAAMAIMASNVVNIETLQLLGAANSYDLVLGNGIAGAGTFTIDASAAASLTLDLTAATSSGYIITGSNGGDSIILSGSGANAVTAGLGADQVTCGAAVDTIVTGAVADSTGAGGYDTINAFAFGTDKFDLAGAHTVTDVNATFALVDSATFDADLTAASVGPLADDGVLFVIANAGDLAGHVFMVVDVNNDGLYQAGADYVFDIVNSTGTPGTGDFI